jgi:hypothetical protein
MISATYRLRVYVAKQYVFSCHYIKHRRLKTPFFKQTKFLICDFFKNWYSVSLFEEFSLFHCYVILYCIKVNIEFVKKRKNYTSNLGFFVGLSYSFIGDLSISNDDFVPCFVGESIIV